MRRVVVTTFALAVIVVTGMAAADDPPAKIDVKKLIGKWELKDEGMQATIEYRPDGKFAVLLTSGLFAGKGYEGTYKVEGNKLTQRYLMTSGEEHEHAGIMLKLTDDVMETEDGREKDGKKIITTMKRVREEKK